MLRITLLSEPFDALETLETEESEDESAAE